MTESTFHCNCPVGFRQHVSGALGRPPGPRHVLDALILGQVVGPMAVVYCLPAALRAYGLMRLTALHYWCCQPVSLVHLHRHSSFLLHTIKPAGLS